ncbi:MAG: hypothetical protein ACRDH2_04580, partial [Anaerolineales bacterium]
LGLDIGQSPDVATYFASSTVFACCIGVFDVLLMAGLGALGGLLWYQIVGQKGTAGTPPAPTMPA